MSPSERAARSSDANPTLPAGTPLTTSGLTTVIGDPGSPPSTHEPYTVGNVLDGQYRVLDVKGGPGISGMGVVYIVERGGVRYAAKTFQHQFSQNLSLVQRFLREARTWILTGFHANIVHAYYLDIVDASPYLFMEYIEPDEDGSISLADRLRKGPLNIEETLRLAIQCCDGMIHATSSVAGLVHRDLKPENLLITRDGTLKITDFGLVRCNITEETMPLTMAEQPVEGQLTLAGSMFGTPAYMAPEQFVEAGTVGQAADIYAFGCCLYEAVSGARLFTIRGDTELEHLLELRRFHQNEPPEPLLSRAPHCPQELDRIVMRCLEKAPGDRWESFTALRDQLARVLEHTFGAPFTVAAWRQPTARQVASQIRSLTLLDGYQRAVRLRNLRENQDSSPYAFHLALASYFHCTDEPEEERRQLEKALRVRGPQQGYEVVRRLGELLVSAGELDRAAQLLDQFLSDDPDSLDRCLEPYVALCIARGAYSIAEQLVARFPRGRRTEALLTRIYRSAGRWDELAALYIRQLEETLTGIQEMVGSVGPGDHVGWENAHDVDILKEVLHALAPECPTNTLDHAVQAVWPDLEAYPDFSAEMAWLSEALGGLAEIEQGGTPEQRTVYRRLARRLGYPDRLADHLMRDENWFWTSGAGEDSDAP